MRNKTVPMVLSGALIMLALAGCGSSNDSSKENAQGQANNGTEQSESAKAADPVKLTLWTFVEQHQKFYESMAQVWNQQHPDEQIELEATTIPYDDMHTKLLLALQSGSGAPDLADVEQSKFPNFVKGKPQLVELNDIVEPELNNIVKSRVDIYSKDGKYYGIDFHVGATVMYYNKEILDQAGVNPDDIRLWSDVEKYGKQVLEKTGKPFITFEGNGNWSWWPAINQRGSDQVDKDGNPTVDAQVNIDTMNFFQKLVKDKIAAVAPGVGHDTEEYKGYMNNGGAASVFMPFWFMGRFTDEMPDLKGKMVIRPMPAWDDGGYRSAGMGGTATTVTNQSKHIDLAKKFTAFAKLSKEGNIEIWKQLGFDPIRTEVWSDPAMKEANKFTEYFGADIFDTLLEVKDEINPVNIRDISPKVFDEVRNEVIPQIFQQMSDPATVLKGAQEKLVQQK